MPLFVLREALVMPVIPLSKRFRTTAALGNYNYALVFSVMDGLARDKAGRRLCGLLMLIMTVLGFLAGFRGPFAFVRRPSLILSPLYAPSFSVEEIALMRGTLERELAAEGSHTLYPKSLIENFYLERDNNADVFDGEYRGREEAFALAEGLGVERTAVASVYRWGESVRLSLTVYDIQTDQRIGHASLDTSSMESFHAWEDSEGERFDLATELEAAVPGLSVGAVLYLGWLGLFGLIGLLIFIGTVLAGPGPGPAGPGRFPGRLGLEVMFSGGLLLFLFSWIYALNGDMDYVQRFLATSGLLQLEDTRAERGAALLRYAAPMLILGALWAADARRRLRGMHRHRGAKADFFDTTAPLWSLLSALLYALSLPNFLILQGIPVLAWAATAPLILVLRRVHPGRGFALTLLFAGVQSLIINWWQGTFSYISLPFTVSLTLVKYLPFALLLPLTLYRRSSSQRGIWAAPFLWVGFDWVSSLGFLGYPWGLLGVSQYGTPALIQTAALGGIWAVSFLTHISGAALAAAAERFMDARGTPALRFPRNIRGIRLPKGVWVPLLAAAGGIGLTALGGQLTAAALDARNGAGSGTGNNGRTVRILLLQQNTDPRKHDYALSFDELSRLTEEAVEAHRSEGPFDLAAWPESGFVPDIRYWLDDGRSRRRRGKLVRSFLDWQADTAVPLVTGNQDHFYEPLPPDDDPETPDKIKRIRNSALYLAPDRRDDFDRNYYYKIRLVPFTENFPYREQFPWVAELLHNFSTTQWTPGTEYTVLQAPRFRFSTPICFEDVFPDHVRRFVRAGAEVLVNISNDYWANTPLEGYQHGAHAVFRAVENRRPLVRATSSGWTISVDAQGRIASDWPDFYTPGSLAAEHRIPDNPPTTLYSRFGDWFPILSLVVWAVFAAVNFKDILGDFRRRGGAVPFVRRRAGDE